MVETRGLEPPTSRVILALSQLSYAPVGCFYMAGLPAADTDDIIP